MNIRIRLLVGLALALAACAPRAETLSVTFRLSAPGLPDGTRVYLAGGAPEVGDWRADGVAMSRTADGKWEATVSFARAMTLEYKYTLGSWAHEGADGDGRPLPNFHARLEPGTVVVDAVARFTTERTRPAPVGQVTGEVRHHPGLEHPGLLPRDAWVWLPPGYADQPHRRYPVLYLHDGQNVFDPATSSFGIDWGVDETVDRLVREGSIEPLIVVAVNNSAERTADYSPGPTGEAYMDFMVSRLKPMIDATYRTLPQRGHTLVGGASMGGLISCMLGWAHPEVFGAALCFSPAFRIEGRADWSGYFTASADTPGDVYFYLDNGGIGLEEQLQPGIDWMLGFMAQRGLVPRRDFEFVIDPDAAHGEPAWAERFPGALLRALEALGD